MQIARDLPVSSSSAVAPKTNKQANKKEREIQGSLLVNNSSFQRLIKTKDWKVEFHQNTYI